MGEIKGKIVRAKKEVKCPFGNMPGLYTAKKGGKVVGRK